MTHPGDICQHQFWNEGLLDGTVVVAALEVVHENPTAWASTYNAYPINNSITNSHLGCTSDITLTIVGTNYPFSERWH